MDTRIQEEWNPSSKGTKMQYRMTNAVSFAMEESIICGRCHAGFSTVVL